MDIKPSTDALAHSRQLSNLIQSEIEKSHGWIPFSTYMALALYAPKLGYYSAGAHKIGFSGDFITAPELSPWFGATIAQTIQPVLEYFKNTPQKQQILEFGAGSGALAQSILEQLQKADQLPEQYLILEVSPDLRSRQEERLTRFKEASGCSTQISWVDQLPQNFSGVMLANEVIDAMPVELIIKRADGWHQLSVAKTTDYNGEVDRSEFQLIDGPLVDQEILPPLLKEGGDELPIGYQTEIHPQAQAWIASLAEAMDAGLFLTFDYGFPAREYYHAQRSGGTLMAHYRHHAIPDPFYFPGLSDITAHVEFTSLSQTAAIHGLNLLGYQSQGGYLLNAGIGELLLSSLDPRDAASYLPHANAVQKLLSEAEMGELFKAIALGKSNDANLINILESLPGFTGRLRSL
jgi:SAM-dependent MidA family methyltransferase